MYNVYHRLMNPELALGIVISGLLHAAAVGSYWLLPQNEVVMGGAPVMSVSLVNAEEAHRPRQKKQQPVQDRPARTQSVASDMTSKPADDLVDSIASQSSAVQQPAIEEAISEAHYSADYLHNPKPMYPPLSRRLGEEGIVMLEVEVSATGLPVSVKVKKSSGFHRLDDAAVDVVERWKFVPAKQGNTALASRVDIPLQFSLER